MPIRTQGGRSVAAPGSRIRNQSTSQESRSSPFNEQTSAMLHGKDKRAMEKSNKDIHKHRAPKSAPHHPTPAQTHNAHAPDNRSGRHNRTTASQKHRPNQASKRKAEDQISHRPARRRTAPHLKDEAYMRNTLQIPTSQDYPELPAGSFKNIKATVMNCVQGLAQLRADIKQLAGDAHQCTLYFTSAARNEVVIGEGRTKNASENAAYLHLVANFHEQGVLSEVLNRKSGFNSINQQVAKQEREKEKTAIVDIYNYAARFDAVPQIKGEAVSQTERGRLRKSYSVTVELFEQGIQVSGRGRDLMSAEINAGLKFKQEAERYHASRGSEAIVIKDSSALTTENATKFFDFYRILRPGISIETKFTQVSQGNRGFPRHRAQVLVNGNPTGEPVEGVLKKQAESLAFLTASIALKKNELDLYPRFLRALKSGHGQILKPLSPMDMPVDDDCSLVMRETLLGARKAGLPDEVGDSYPSSMEKEVSGGSYRRWNSAATLEHLNWSLKRKLSTYLQDEKLADLRNKKAELPMNQYSGEVLNLVNDNTYSIIVGATGSGKTTQVPQILLEQAITQGEGGSCNIMVTQPRRIAATSVARRVAVERAEALQESIGYHVRFDAKLPQIGGSVTYCTTGILLQLLQHHPDDVMDHNSHLVIDEVHERDMQIDFLLILLKKTVTRRKAQGKTVPKIVMMSATMDTELFASYFKSEIAGEGIKDCPSLSVPGRTFPVTERYLDEVVKEMKDTAVPSQLQAMYVDVSSRDYLDAEERFRHDNPRATSNSSFQIASNSAKEETSVIDWKRERALSAADGDAPVVSDKETGLIPFGLIACTIAHIAKTTQEGAVLVFLPGLAEITKVQETLNQYNFGVDFRDPLKFKIFMLHSSISASQNTVFDAVEPGCRKIILATNIAETSVTIPDVQYVVDTGKLREKQYDQARRISQLSCTWISKSNAKQRAGRAGRVQNGNYYALYTKERFDSLRAIGLPELLRTDLQEICLEIKSQAFKTPIRDFLAEAIEAPSAQAVDASVYSLEALDALTEDEQITPLGRLLASLPVHPTLGKMIVLGVIFRCLDPMLVLGAAASERSLFQNPLEARNQAQEAKLAFVRGSGSDHIAVLNAVREMRRIRDTQGERFMFNYARQNFLHTNAFKTIDNTASQISDILVEAGLIPRVRYNERAQSEFGHLSLNENSDKVPLIKALTLAGCHPNLAVNVGGRAFRTPGEKGAIVHPASVNGPKDKRDTPFRFGTLYSYGTMSRSNDGNNTYLRETTESSPLMACLFGGKLRRNEERSNILEIDNWLPFYVTSFDRRTAKTILEFRKALERLLAVTFKDMGQLMGRQGQWRGEVEHDGKFLADEEVRQFFADGLVEVLDRDVKVNERTAKKGWGNVNLNTKEDRDKKRRQPSNDAAQGLMADLMKF